MDKDSFQQWKDSQATQWVLQWLRDRASAVEEEQKRLLFQSALHLDPDQWSARQVSAGHDAGYVRAIAEMLDLNFEDISPEEEGN